MQSINRKLNSQLSKQHLPLQRDTIRKWKPSWPPREKKINDQEEEIEDLYDLQDKLEQYTRKNSLEIHGVPESAYMSTEEVVLKLAEALNVDVKSEDVEISETSEKRSKT